MNLLAVGTVAFDAIETPFGKEFIKVSELPEILALFQQQ